MTTADIGGGVLPPWADLEAYRAEHRQRNPIPPAGAVVAGLAERRQWLVWRYEPGETPEKKPRKMPYYARGGKRFGDQGTDKDRAALVAYAEAAELAGRRGFDGVGFAFLPGDGLVGIDLDGMIDAESGEVSERCLSIVRACASYTELSPSGKGVHIICAGETETFKSNKAGVEVFAGRQYFTFTGKVWGDAPVEVRPLGDGALAMLKGIVDEAKGAGLPRAAASRPASSAPPPQASSFGGRQRSLAETVALAEEALGHLDPDEYQQWIDVGLSCKAGLGAAGFMVWDAWSARGSKYAGQQDTESRWHGFKPTSITLGTLFGLAEQAGWVSPWAKARSRKPRAAKASSPAPVSAYGEDPPPATVAPARGEIDPPGAEPLSIPEPSEPPEQDWALGLLKKKGDVTPCLANAELLLSNMTKWRGVVAYDEFAERTVFRGALPFDPRGPTFGEWSDHLDVSTAIWLQRAWGVEFSPTCVAQAVEVVARRNRFHPVRDALAALPPWDGVARNADWLSDCLGVARTEYTALVGQFFLRGMIKRVMEPGCKFDYCLVLEGAQGRGKSTAARILAWRWFGDTDLDLGNKDALLSLPGHWVYEIAEMGSLMKAEERKQKSFLSRQEDEYRPPYGKRLIKVPRQSVFIGTTNEEEYLKDATGARRFWPVMCDGDFNLDALRSNLEQMFAEALIDYGNGERCWPNPEEQERFFTPEQAKRGMPEPFEDLLGRWVDSQVQPFSMADACCDGLKLTPDKLTPAVVTRVGMALSKIGCGRREDRLAKDASKRRLYLSPTMARAELRAGGVRSNVDEDADVRF